MTRLLLTAIALCCMAGAAQAQSCNLQASDKKLAGAAKTSFLTKCEKDAGAAPEPIAAKGAR